MEGPVSDLRIVVASGAQERLAEAIVARRYAWRGYRDELAPMAYLTLIAMSGRWPVGTITLGMDSPAGLLADGNYRAEIDAVRSRGGRACELVRFAVESPRGRGGVESKRILAAGVQAIVALCEDMQMTDVLVEVNPRHVGYYRRALGFEVFGPPRRCARASAPSVLMRRCLGVENHDVGSFTGDGWGDHPRNQFPCDRADGMDHARDR